LVFSNSIPIGLKDLESSYDAVKRVLKAIGTRISRFPKAAGVENFLKTPS
jgi:hypothetical protein